MGSVPLMRRSSSNEGPCGLDVRENSIGGATVDEIVGDAISLSWKGIMWGVVFEGSGVVGEG